MDGDLTWAGEHIMQCTDDVLWNSAPKTCIILLTNVTPKHSIKRRKKKNMYSIATILTAQKSKTQVFTKINKHGYIFEA